MNCEQFSLSNKAIENNCDDFSVSAANLCSQALNELYKCAVCCGDRVARKKSAVVLLVCWIHNLIMAYGNGSASLFIGEKRRVPLQREAIAPLYAFCMYLAAAAASIGKKSVPHQLYAHISCIYRRCLYRLCLCVCVCVFVL